MSDEKKQLSKEDLEKQAAGLYFVSGLVKALSERGYEKVAEDDQSIQKAIKTAKVLRTQQKSAKEDTGPVIRKVANETMDSILAL